MCSTKIEKKMFRFFLCDHVIEIPDNLLQINYLNIVNHRFSYNGYSYICISVWKEMFNLVKNRPVNLSNVNQ